MSKGRNPHCYRRLDISVGDLRNNRKLDEAVALAIKQAADKHGIKLEYGNAEYINDGEVWGRFILRGSSK